MVVFSFLRKTARLFVVFAFAILSLAALTLAEANDILVTAAAGNYGLDNDTTPIYPASYPLPNIISVAALDIDDALASFSNFGKTSVDIAAPGVNILSTLPGNNYGLVSGTSFSAPMVAAVLAVLPKLEAGEPTASLKTRLADLFVPAAYAAEALEEMTLQEFLNLLFGSVQSWTGLEGKVKGGKVLRFEQGESETPTTAPSVLPPLQEEVGVNELLNSALIGRYETPWLTQDFLEGHPGILKDYVDEKGRPGFRNIESSTHGLDREVKLVMLELKANAITDPNLTDEDIENVFGISEVEIHQMWFEHSNSPIANPGLGTPGIEWNNFTEEDYQEGYAGLTPKLFRQMDYFGRYYAMITSGAWEITDPIIFTDGSQVTIEQCTAIPIEEKPYDKCTRIFALKVVLAELADSKDQYEHWTSFEEGSFFDIYNRFFGFPHRLFADPSPSPTPKLLEPLGLDFLKSAYDKSDSCGIASVFDHQFPNYGENDYTVFFSGSRLNSASNQIGYNSYDGHNGLDVHVRDCSKEGGATNNGKPLYAAADGIVDEVGTLIGHLRLEHSCRVLAIVPDQNNQSEPQSLLQ